MTRGLALLLVPVLIAAAPLSDEQVLQQARVGKETGSLVGWLRRQTLTAAQRARLRSLLPQLGSDDYAKRIAASRGVLEFGPPALPYLRRALNDPDEEIKERVRIAIAALEPKSNPAVNVAVARLLRNRRGAEVLYAVLDSLPDTDGDTEEELLATLAVLAVEEGKVAPVVADALRDAEPGRRAGAALVVGRFGSAEQQASARGMSEDADFLVRLRAGQGLLARRDPAALPLLAALVGTAPAPVALRADDFLAAVARERAPRLLWADDTTTRRRCRAAWDNWVRFFGRTDLARADFELPPGNRSLQAAAAARSLFQALIHNDRERLHHLSGVPFLGPNDTVATKPEEVDTVLGEFARMLGQGDPGRPPAVMVRFFEPGRSPTTTPAMKAFFGRLPGTELRGVRLTWRPPQPSPDVQVLVLIVRISRGGPQVIGLSQPH
jgi:hypothetical protein